MTLNEFISEQKARVEAFRLRWLEAHYQRPDLFPNDLQHGDWDDQFMDFDPNQPFEIPKDDGEINVKT